MPEKHGDLLHAILAQRNKASGQSLLYGTFAVADIMAVRLQKQCNDATMCAIIAQFIRDLRLRRLSSNLAYITSVFIGYIGTD